VEIKTETETEREKIELLMNGKTEGSEKILSCEELNIRE
jgi:hypothetical protein